MYFFTEASKVRRFRLVIALLWVTRLMSASVIGSLQLTSHKEVVFLGIFLAASGKAGIVLEMRDCCYFSPHPISSALREAS
jgi:hypothetical protein